MTIGTSSLLRIGLILSLAIIPYLNTMDKSFSFIYDDIDLIVKNKNINNLSPAFIKDSFINKDVYNVAIGEIYRPFYIILYAIEYQLWNLNPIGYHAVNALLNATNALIAYLLLCNLLCNKKLSLLGALVFAVHPVHTENVAWIKETTTLLSSFFLFSAIFYYMRYRKFKTNLSLTASILLFIFSLLSKETSIVFPLLIVTIDIYLLRQTDLRMKWLPWIPFFFISIIFLWVRTTVLGQVAQSNYYSGGTLWTTFFTMFRVVAYYLKLLFFPIELCGDYYQYQLSANFDMSVAASAGLLAMLLISALWQARKNPLVPLGIGFFIITLLPVLNIIPVKILMAERFLYLPSFGLILSVFALVDTLSREHRAKWVLLVSISIVLFSILTYKRNFVWQNQSSFWSDVVDKMPGNSRAHYNLALSQGDLNIRIKELKTALYLNPTDELSRSKLALTLSQKGDYGLAVELYMDILKRKPNDRKTLNALARIYFAKGDYENSKDIFEKLIGAEPSNPQLLNSLGSVYDMLKEHNKAMVFYNRALEIEPDNIETYCNIGIAYNREGRYREAEDIYKKAISLSKDSELLHFGLGETYFNMGDYSEAIIEFKKTADINPKNPDAAYNLAYLYASKRDYQASIYWLDRAVNSGFKDLESLKEETVFEPLKRYDRFRRLIR